MEQEREQQILSEEVKFDKDLVLSNDSEEDGVGNNDGGFKRIIEESIQSAESLEENLGVKEISYPNDYVFASLANRVYEEWRNVDRSADDLYGKAFDQELGNWQLLTVAENKNYLNGYVGAAYWNPDTQQIIIAHRGTQPNDGGTVLGTMFTNVKGVFFNQHAHQIDSAVTFTERIISVLRKIKKEPYIQLFFTGHSLGGWLAQITTFTAKYLIRDGDNFVKNGEFEETGYHASAVIFDSPGARDMLLRIQDRLMNRYGPSYIDSLDVTSYLSAPNLINACKPQVGEVYRIHTILSEDEKKQMQASLIQYVSLTHKRQKFKEVFDPETGKVSEDEEGKLRIERVCDWPLLITEDEVDKALIRGKIEWGAEALAQCILPAWTVMLSKFAYSVYKKYNDLNQELSSFFTSANEYNGFHLDEESARIQVGENYYRIIRYRTKKLDSNYKNERSLNAFKQPERKFLEEYNFLKKCQEKLSGIVTLEKLFTSFKGNEKLVSDTTDMLKSCTVESGVIRSENLQRFIPYIKRVLHLFPEMKQEVARAYQEFPSDLHNRLYQIISSLYLNTINSLDFKENTLNLRAFLEGKDLKILHTVQSCTSLGATRVYKSFNMVRNEYENEKHHAFLNLDRIFYLGEEIFISFLKKIDYKYLLVVESDDVLNDKIKEFLEKLFSALEDNHNIKVILATEKDSDLSKSISEYVVNNPLKCQEEHSEVKWNDLTSDSQRNLLDKTVVFQGREVPLNKVVNDSNDLDTIIDPETIVELLKNKKIEIGKPLPSLGETEGYYIERKLVKKVKVKEEVLKDDNLTDIFAVSNISKEELSRLAGGRKVHSFNEEDPDRSNPVRFKTLNENVEENFNGLRNRYSDFTIHWLERKNNGDLIWRKSHGKTLSGLRRYIENYESDLPEKEYSSNNTSIKMVDVNDISNFDERLIVIAAEPGMGKTTALTRFGTQKADASSKWIIRLNLVEYKDKLEQINFSRVDDVIAFLHENNIVSNALAKKLVKSRLNNSGNIVFLLDGFDEITSKGQTNVVNLIKKLQENEVEKVLISTRLHLRNELENSLSTVAYTLKPFSREDQAEFLRKFWHRDSGIDQGRLDNYINRLLEFISKSIGDKERKLMGIPMQMRMVAEAFQEATKNQELLDHPERTFPENFDMLKLYDHFVDAKYRIYLGKIGAEKVDLSNPTRKRWFTLEVREAHKKLSFKELFSDIESEVKDNLIDEKSIPETDKQEINLVGIAQFIDDRIIFTHRTFGEYFAASFLADKLSKNKSSKEYKPTIEFLTQEIFKSKNEVIKAFLDYRLAKEEIHAATLKKGKLDDVILSEENINVTDNLGRSALHYAAQEGHREIVDILLRNGVNIRKSDELGKTALHYAARYNHGTEVVSCLLENAKDCINKKDKNGKNGRTPVYYAAQQGNWDIVDFLIEKGADTSVLDQQALMFHYTYQNNLQLVKTLVEQGVDIATEDNHGNTLLNIAAQRGYLAIVDFLLEKGALVGVANNSGKKPISHAAEKEHWSIVESLLRKKAKFNDLSGEQKDLLLDHSAKSAHWDIVKLFMEDNGKDNYFSRLYHSQQRVELLCYLIRSKDLDIAEFLIKKGTEVNNSDKNSRKPIHYAAENGHWRIVELLLRKKADLNDLNEKQKLSLLRDSAQNVQWDVVELYMKDGNRENYFGDLSDEQKIHCLYYVISVGDLDITRFFVEKLIEEGKICNVNTPNSCGKTFLHFAAQGGKLNIVQYLVGEKGANLDAITSSGSTALQLAAGNGHLGTVKYLVDEKNVDVNQVSNDGSTALHWAARNGHSEIVKYLTGKDANISIKDSNGKIPLNLAAENHHLEAVGYLKEEEARIFYNQNRYNEAYQVYKEVFDIQKRRDVLGPNHPHTLSTRHNMALVLYSQGKYDNAYNVYKEALDKRKVILEPDHPDILTIQNNLAEVLNKQGKYSEALEAFQHVFKKREEILSLNHPDTLMTRHNMAEVLDNQGNYSKALEEYQEVFEKRRNVLGPNHPDTLTTQNNIAKVLCSQGKYDDALKTYKEVWDKIKVTLGPEHPGTLSTRHGIAEVHEKQGNYTEAMETYQAVFDKRREVLGPHHPDTLSTHIGMAEIHFKQGNYNKALEIYKEVFEKREKILGPDHPDTLTAQYSIAGVLYGQSEYGQVNDNAYNFCEYVLNKRKAILGPDHPYTLIAQHNMAHMLSDQGKYDDALKIYKELLDREKAVIGADHPGSLKTSHNMATTLYNQGNYNEALRILQEVLNMEKTKLGSIHPDTLDTCHNMAAMLNNQGNYTEASRILQEVLNIKKDQLGSNHPDTLDTQYNMAEVLYKQGKYTEAFNIYEVVFVKRRDVLGSDHPDTLKTRYDMAVMLSKQSNYSEALKIYREVFEKRRDVLGPNHPDTLETRYNMAFMLSRQSNYSEALEIYREVFEKRRDVLGPNHPDTLRAQRSITTVSQRLDSGCSIQFHQKQEKAFLHLSQYVPHHFPNALVESVKQGLYLPSFEKRKVKMDGKCTIITRSLSQALFLQSDKSFLTSLDTSAEIYERIARGKQISKREEREVFTFSKLLRSFERQLDSSTSSLPSDLIYAKGYKALGDLSNCIAGVGGDFAVHLVTSDHVVAIYRTDDNYAYFDSNTAFVCGLKSVDQLMKIVEKAVKSAGYKVEEKGFLVEHFNVDKANNLLSDEGKQVLTREIKTERHLLAEQDMELGLVKINGQEVSRVQLYDFGTKINVEGGVPLLINADMNLNSKKFQDHLDKKEVSVTAREYLDGLKNIKNVEEVVQATKLIPFIGPKREIEEAEQTRKPLLEQLVKGTINCILAAVSLKFQKRHEKVS